MKSNFQLPSKMDLKFSLRGLKIRTLFGVLRFVDWLLTKLHPYGTGIGSGRKYFVQPLLITLARLYLFLLPRVIITSTTSMKKDKGGNQTTNRGGLQATTTHTSRRRKKKKRGENLKKTILLNKNFQ